MEEVDGIDWIPWRFLGVGKRKWEVCNIAKADTYVISRHLEAFGDILLLPIRYIVLI